MLTPDKLNAIILKADDDWNTHAGNSFSETLASYIACAVAKAQEEETLRLDTCVCIDGKWYRPLDDEECASLIWKVK